MASRGSGGGGPKGPAAGQARRSTVGKRYSKRETLGRAVEVFDWDSHHLLSPRALTAMKDWAMRMLTAHGIDVIAVLAAWDGTNDGEGLRLHVASIQGTEHDDLRALAARIFELCRLIELHLTDERVRQWVAAAGGAFALGFELGRLSMLAKVYGIDSAMAPTNRANAKKPRPNRHVCDHDELRQEFLRLVREGHSPGNARGILKERGPASQATIYRVTKDAEKSVR